VEARGRVISVTQRVSGYGRLDFGTPPEHVGRSWPWSTYVDAYLGGGGSEDDSEIS